MTFVLGIIGAAVLFGLFSMIRPGDRPGSGCTGRCAGCTRDGACRTGEVEELKP